MSQISRNHRLINEILVVLGIVIIFFSIPSTILDLFPEELEDIIYFRILLFSQLIIITGLIRLLNSYLLKNILIALNSGLIGLIFISTVNLFLKSKKITDFYFLLTFLIVFLAIIILLIVKKWKN